jgi:hypothetical protein
MLVLSLLGTFLFTLTMSYRPTDGATLDPLARQAPASIELDMGWLHGLATRALCGPLCVFAIMKYSGRDANLKSVIAATPNLNGKTGCSLRDIEKCAEAQQLAMHCARLKFSYLGDYTLPIICHTKSLHFVVLTAVSKDSIGLFDPARLQIRTMTRDEFLSFADPYGLVWDGGDVGIGLWGGCGIAMAVGLLAVTVPFSIRRLILRRGPRLSSTAACP